MADNTFIIEIRSKGFGPAKSNTKALEGSIAQLRQEVNKHKKGLEQAVVGSKQFELRQRTLEQSSKRLKAAMEKVNAANSQYVMGANSMRGATSGLRRSVGALRNNILLVTFALSGAIMAVKKFVDIAAGFESVKTRLVGLTGSVGQAERAFIKFNAVAATTPFSLSDVVEAGAQLKAFGADAEGLIKPVTDLAAFMGTTAVEAANAFGRAFAGGAGAADILRERGIINIIKASQGLVDLSKTTLPDFRKALISSLQDPAVGIAGSTERLSKTYVGAMSNMKDAVTRFQATVGDLLLPILTKAANRAEKFFRAIDIEGIEDFARGVAALTTALTLYSVKVLIASARTLSFSKVLRISLVGLIAVGIERLMTYMGLFDDWDKLIDKNTGTLLQNTTGVRQNTQALKTQKSVVGTLNVDLKAHNEMLEETEFLQMKLRGATSKEIEAAKLLVSTQRQINDVIPEGVKAFVGLTETADGMALSLGVVTESGKELGDDAMAPLNDIMENSRLKIKLLEGDFSGLGAEMNKLFGQTVMGQEEALSLLIKSVEDYGLEILGTVEKQDSVLEHLRNTLKGLSSDAKEFKTMQDLYNQTTMGQKENLEQLIETVKKYNEEAFGGAEGQAAVLEMLQGKYDKLGNDTKDLEQQAVQTARAIGSIGNAVLGLMNSIDKGEASLGDYISALGSIVAMIPGGAAAGAGMQIGGQAMNLMGIGHQGGLVTDQGIQTFHEGGLVKEDIPASIQTFHEGGLVQENIPVDIQTFHEGGLVKESIPVGIQTFHEGGLVKESIPVDIQTFHEGGLVKEDIPVAHQGGFITKQGIQTFQAGGMIQGADDVPILAQGGEFVMNRDAVSNIGLQRLALMNETDSMGPGGNEITLNISAPLVDEHIVDIIIPALKNAISLDLA